MRNLSKTEKNTTESGGAIAPAFLRLEVTGASSSRFPRPAPNACVGKTASLRTADLVRWLVEFRIGMMIVPQPHGRENTMRVFVAGASGAIGEPLIAELLKQGHSVVGMTTSAKKAEHLQTQGADAVVADALDPESVATALRRFEPEAVIDELTALPKEMSDMPKYAEGDRKVRLEGGGNLFRASVVCGVRRYLQQSSGFFLKASSGALADESSPLDVDASPSVAASARTYRELEERLFSTSSIEGIALRYGFFYGPKTWYHPGEAAATMVMRQQNPVVGKGNGISSFVHIADAAIATVAALSAAPGVYNLVDDDPSPQSIWLPAFARFVGAPVPPHLSEEDVRALAGEDAVYYATRLSGASNAKAKRMLGWKPRRLEWLAA
jgi:nucleoside-diphosphate-sugar epimerase